MSIFKCKMCGGDLEITEGASVAECQYCGSKQTLPRFDSDRKRNLYDRAGHFRRNNEFDKAEGIYENILNEDPTDAEAYWSLVLCRYGIEYVEDPATHKRVPTVNRAQYTSVFADENYKKAVEYADTLQRELYEAEAKTIDAIQKGILEISEKEEPFDVFICYKETDDATKERTRDSLDAQEIYYNLTQEGYRVFFARITLEDKVGSEYEPYIFAALNSAKVMVVIGEKAEHFSAVWVKNEWSRFLSLIRKDRSRLLLPCYKNMDPYDLPEQLSILQSYDMAKIGFMQDLIRGIKKVLAKDEPKETVQPIVQQVIHQSVGGVNLTSQVKRGMQALEDKDWTAADGFFDKALDMDAECAEAFFGKALVTETCSTEEEFIQKRLSIPVDIINVLTACEKDSEQIKRVIEEYALPGYLEADTIRSYFLYDERSYDSLTNAWQSRLKQEEIYWSKNRNLSRAVRYAAEPFASKIKGIRSKIDEALNVKLSESIAADERNAREVRERYVRELDKAETALKAEYEKKLNARKDEYDRVCKLQEAAQKPEDFSAVALLFENDRLQGYADSSERAKQCRKEADRLVQTYAKLERERASKKKRLISLTLALLCICVAAAVILIAVIIPKHQLGDNDTGDLYKTNESTNLSSPSTAPTSTPNPASATATQAPASPQPDDNGSEAAADGEAVVLKTDYYSITIPARINGKYTVRQHPDSIALYEIQSLNDGTGGRFFELVMYDADDFSFLDVPNIDSFLGMITTKNGDQHLLFLWQNTDVQWSQSGYDDFVLCSECSEEIVASITPLYGATLTEPKRINPESKQIVIIDTNEYNGKYSASLALAEWNGSEWIPRLLDIPASIGSNGTTDSKREGDRCTPSGKFNILFCFSNQTLDTALRQKHLTDGDVWVTDQNSRYYNTIQANGASIKDWNKSENIYRQFTNSRSIAGILFDYNGDGEHADSATPGGGSALFLDGIGSSGDLNSGYGDIKISGEDMLQLLRMLDQSLNPTIIIESVN